MNRLICTSLVGLLFAANLAHAGEGFALGISAARANIDVNDTGINVNGDANGWRFFGLYKLTHTFGIEAGISSFDRPDDNTIPSNFEVETESYDVFAVATYPFSDKASLFGKAGFVSWNTEVENEDETFEVTSRSTDLALGFGGEYGISERFAFRGEIDWFNSQNSGAANMLSLSAVYRFD